MNQIEMIHRKYDKWLESRKAHGSKKRKNIIDGLKTKDDVIAWAGHLKEWFREITGPLVPLPEMRKEFTGRLDCKGYTIEKWLFDVFPGTYASANLYVPEQMNGDGLAMVAAMGHWNEGKACTDYQSMAGFFASHGVPVLVYDHAGLGERREHWDPVNKMSVCGDGAVENHIDFGDLSALAGMPVVRYFITEAVRAREFLAGFDYVNEKKIGITGASGGGSVSRAAACYSDDFAFCIPVCIIQDDGVYCDTCPEQINWLSGIEGVSHIDQLISNVPRPGMVVTEHIDGPATSSFAGFKRLYELAEASGAAEYFQIDDVHGYTHPMVEAIYVFLSKHFSLPTMDMDKWQRVKRHTYEDLSCSPSGFMNRDYPQRTMRDVIKQELKEPLGLDSNRLRKILKLDNASDFDVPAAVHGSVKETMRVTGMLSAGSGDIGLIEWEGMLAGRPQDCFTGMCELYRSRDNFEGRGLFCFDLDLVSLRVKQILDFLEANKGKVKRLEAQGKWAIPLVFTVALADSDLLAQASVSHLLGGYEMCFDDIPLRTISQSDMVTGILKYGDLDEVVSICGNRLNIISRTDAWGRVIWRC